LEFPTASIAGELVHKYDGDPDTGVFVIELDAVGCYHGGHGRSSF